MCQLNYELKFLLAFITNSWLNVMNMIDMRKWSSIYRLGKNNFLA